MKKSVEHAANQMWDLGISWPLVVWYLQGLITPVIAGVAVYIAWQQWKTNARRLRWDWYAHRLRVYEEVKKIRSIVLRDGAVTTDDLLKFIGAVAEADFLLGPEIVKYIDEIYKHGLNLATADTQYRENVKAPMPGYDNKKLAEEMNAEVKWFLAQYDIAQKKFRKYLSITK